MSLEEKYKKEYGKQVAKYLKNFGLTDEDLGKLIKSSSDNIRNIISGTVGLNIGKMIKIASMFATHYYNFANPSFPLPKEEDLPEKTKKKILERKTKGVIKRDDEGLLANELDKLIKEGKLKTPKTAKALLSLMDKSFEKRNPSEITNLFNKAPRKKTITKLDKKIDRQNVFVDKDFINQYNNLSIEELRAYFKEL